MVSNTTSRPGGRVLNCRTLQHRHKLRVLVLHSVVLSAKYIIGTVHSATSSHASSPRHRLYCASYHWSAAVFCICDSVEQNGVLFQLRTLGISSICSQIKRLNQSRRLNFIQFGLKVPYTSLSFVCVPISLYLLHFLNGGHLVHNSGWGR